MNDIISAGVEAARQAGKLLKDNFGRIGAIESKGDRSLVTNLDKEAEKIITGMIKTKFPGHGILAEETGKDNFHRDYVWVIDPLDGTHNYIREIPLFGVSIGIVHKGIFAGGIIYLPMEDELFAAEKGNGAFKNGKRIAVSARTQLKECSLAFDSSLRYEPAAKLAVLKDTVDAVFNIRMFGTSALVLAYIAEGKLDGTIEFLDYPWDFAGGVCIVGEAGGRFTALDGRPLSLESIGYVCSNGRIHERLLKIVQAAEV